MFESILFIGIFAESFDYLIRIGFGTLDNELQTALEQPAPALWLKGYVGCKVSV